MSLADRYGICDDWARCRHAPVETPAELALPGGPLRYTLRRTPRARGLRVTIHPERGIVVSVPPPTADAAGRIPRAMSSGSSATRERWIRRRTISSTASRPTVASRAGAGAGRAIPFSVPHLVRVHVVDLARRSRVVRLETTDGPELHVELAEGERRAPADVLEAWLRAQAQPRGRSGRGAPRGAARCRTEGSRPS